MRGLALCVIAGCSFTGLRDPGGDAATTDGPVVPGIDADLTLDADLAIDADTTPDATTTPDANTSVCSTAGMVCPGSSPQMFTCSGGCWVGCNNGTPITHAAASQICADWGGRLTPLENHAQLLCVRAAISAGSAMWIGLTQAPGQSTPGAGWSWNGDGMSPSYTDWGVGQPNDADGNESGFEQCAYSPTGVLWHDEQCAAMYARFACRRP